MFSAFSGVNFLYAILREQIIYLYCAGLLSKFINLCQKWVQILLSLLVQQNLHKNFAPVSALLKYVLVINFDPK